MAFANANGNPFLHTGGIGGISPSADYISQWVNWTCPTYNSTTGFWEIEDKTGTSNIKVTNSNAALFNGTSDYIDTGIKLSGSSFSICLSGRKESGEIISSSQSNEDNTNRTGLFWFSDDKIYALIGEAGVISNYGVKSYSGFGKYHDIRMDYDGSGSTNADKLKLYIDDVYTPFDSFNSTIPSTVITPDNNYVIGRGSASTIFTNSYISRFVIEGYIAYNFSEGASNIFYNKHGGVNGVGVINNISNFWTNDDGRPDNLIDGFDLWEHATLNPIRVPFDVDGNSILTDGDTPPATGYTWTSRNLDCETCKGHNGAESTLTQYEVAELITADARQTTPYWFDGGGNALDKEYPFPANNDGEYIVMSDVDTTNCNKNLLLINRDLTDSEKEALQLYLNQIEVVLDSNDIPIEVEGKGQLYVLKSTYTE